MVVKSRLIYNKNRKKIHIYEGDIISFVSDTHFYRIGQITFDDSNTYITYVNEGIIWNTWYTIHISHARDIELLFKDGIEWI